MYSNMTDGGTDTHTKREINHRTVTRTTKHAVAQWTLHTAQDCQYVETADQSAPLHYYWAMSYKGNLVSNVHDVAPQRQLTYMSRVRRLD